MDQCLPLEAARRAHYDVLQSSPTLTQESTLPNDTLFLAVFRQLSKTKCDAPPTPFPMLCVTLCWSSAHTKKYALFQVSLPAMPIPENDVQIYLPT